MQTVVGVLRGGPSREHEVSLQSGAAMLAALSPERYRARDIYIDKAGHWHLEGRPIAPERILRQIDVALLPLHGEYGESGEVQRLLAQFGVLYVGADAFATNQARHKAISKALAKEAGLLTPDSLLITDPAGAEATAADIIRTFNQPVVVKPVAWGSSVGISIVGGYAPVLAAIQALFDEGAEGVLVEECIRGRKATAGVVEGLRGVPGGDPRELYALPPVEADEICPGRFSRVETEELQCAAKAVHRVLGLRHHSESHFIVTPRGIYYLATTALPRVSPQSPFVRSLTAVGVSLDDFLTHVVGMALA